MDSPGDNIPEEFVDALLNEFAYDPIRLPITCDPAQVLYNRRTLEKIWDTQHNAVNPYTRQPFDISHAIPQIELRQQMSQYIIENSTSCLEVIPVDYTKPLNSTDMQNLLRELVIAGEHCLNAEQSEPNSWKQLCQKLNLVRLYCQCVPENRETFISVKGYEYLFNVINPELLSLYLVYYSSSEDIEEVCKEIAKIVDLLGLKDTDLQTVPTENVSALLQILSELVTCKYSKIQSMVLRIFRRMYDECIDYILERCRAIFSILNFRVALYKLLERPNSADHLTNEDMYSANLTNEDLYNATTILKPACIREMGLEVPTYVDGLVKVVIICISRSQDLHAAATHRAQAQAQAQASSISKYDEEEEKKNINLISRALEQGLFLINCIVMADEEKEYFISEWKETLQRLDIVKDIVRMVELVLSGIKIFNSSQLQLGLNITASLCRQGRVSEMTRNNVVKVCVDFLGSNYMVEYDTQVMQLLEDVLRNVALSE